MASGLSLMGKRKYFRHRRAYAPRLWPMMLGSVIIIVLVQLILQLGLAPNLLIGLGEGFAIPLGRWAIWRRRHPIIPIPAYLDDMRSRAMWN